MSSSTSAYAKACLSIGLASAWAAPSEGAIQSEVSIQSNLPGDLSHARLMLCGSGGGWDVVGNLSLPGVGSGYFQSELAVDPTGTSYSMVGLMDDGSGAMRLVVSHPGLTIIYGDTFENVFNGYSEATLVDLLLNDDPQADWFLLVFADMLDQTTGLQSEWAGYSVGEHVGELTVTWTAIPSPGAIALLPVWLLAARRRR